MFRLCHTAIAFAAAMLWTLSVNARVLEVGSRQALKLPSQAAAVATDGDVVRIDPGAYVDCAIWNASHLLIEASGPGVRIAGKTCADKGIFITEGADITIRGISFADATVAAHNGAAIRAAGRNLTVEGSRFLHNENGILAGGDADSVLRVVDSTFIANGACIAACAHAVYVGAPIDLLDIENCVFFNTKIAHHVKSRARNTIVRHSRIEDGPEGTSSYLIEIPDGGNLLVADNTMQKGAQTSNPAAVISIGVESKRNPTDVLIIRDNNFRNDSPSRTIFVRNSTTTAPAMAGNAISGNVQMLSGPLAAAE